MSATVGQPRNDLQRGVQFLASIQSLVQSLGSTWTIEFALPGGPRQPPRTLRPRKHAAPKQPSIAQVAMWQITGTRRMPARNLFVVTDHDRTMIGNALAQRFAQRVLEGGPMLAAQNLMTAAGFLWRDMVAARFAAGGADLTLPPLTADYVERKRRLGYYTGIGTMTGQTISALRRAQPIARKR